MKNLKRHGSARLKQFGSLEHGFRIERPFEPNDLILEPFKVRARFADVQFLRNGNHNVAAVGSA